MPNSPEDSAQKDFPGLIQCHLYIGFPCAQEKFSKFLMVRVLTGSRKFSKCLWLGNSRGPRKFSKFLWLGFSGGSRKIFKFFVNRKLKFWKFFLVPVNTLAIKYLKKNFLRALGNPNLSHSVFKCLRSHFIRTKKSILIVQIVPLQIYLRTLHVVISFDTDSPKIIT